MTRKVKGKRASVLEGIPWGSERRIDGHVFSLQVVTAAKYEATGMAERLRRDLGRLARIIRTRRGYEVWTSS